MAKVKETKKEIKVPFTAINYLAEKINHLRVPTYGDIAKFKELQDIFGVAGQELQEKIKNLLTEYDVVEVKSGDDKYDEINSKYQDLLRSESSINADDLKVFTKEDFERVYNDSNLTVADALNLENLLVK